MKAMRIKAVVASLLVFSMLASGCAVAVDQPEASGDQMTAEQLAVNVVEEVNNIDSVHTVLDMEINAKVGTGLIGLPAKISGIVDADVVKADPAAHADLSVSVSALGQGEEINAEAYVVTEGDEAIAYINSEGEWQKSEMAAQIPTGVQVERAFIGQITDDILGLTLEDEQVDGCYVLKTTFEGEALQPIVEPVLESADLGLDLSTIDWTAADADAVAYVSADDFRLASIELDCAALGEQIVGLLSQIDEIKAQNVRIALNSFDIVMTYDGYNEVSVELPAELAAM